MPVKYLYTKYQCNNILNIFDYICLEYINCTSTNWKYCWNNNCISVCSLSFHIQTIIYKCYKIVAIRILIICLKLTLRCIEPISNLKPLKIVFQFKILIGFFFILSPGYFDKSLSMGDWIIINCKISFF